MSRRSRFTVLVLTLLAPITDLAAQRPESRFSIGIHGGVDLSDHDTIKLIGGQFSFSLPKGLRIQVAGTSIVEAGTRWFATASLQWHLPRGPVHPFLGAGGALEYAQVGPFSETSTGWFLQGGFEVPTRTVMPFVEFRLLGFSAELKQLLAGFKVEVR